MSTNRLRRDKQTAALYYLGVEVMRLTNSKGGTVWLELVDGRTVKVTSREYHLTIPE